MDLIESESIKNNVKLLEYKGEEKKQKQEKTKSNNQFLRIAKLFEGINKHSGPKDSVPQDLDSAIQCLELCMSYNLD